MFTDGKKSFRVIRNIENYTALQRDLNLLQRWSAQWHLKLGIVFDDQLKFHDHTTQVTIKANRILGLI